MTQDDLEPSLARPFPGAGGLADSLGRRRFARAEDGFTTQETGTEVRLDEDRLLKLARTGNLTAFNQLVILHQDGLYRWITSLVRDPDLAADITQSTFITAYEKLESFRGASFRAWLFRIARNRSIDEFRRQKRRASISLDAVREEESLGEGSEKSLMEFVASDVPQPEETVTRNEQAETIARLLETLPEAYRQVLELVDLEGLDYLEAAQVLAVPLGTVKSRMARARLKFRELALEYGLVS